MAKLIQEGNKVEQLIVSDGSKGSHAIGIDGKRLKTIRQKEQRAAAKVLGVKNVYFLGEIDGEVENTKKLRKKLVEMIRTIKPDVVMSFDPGALHRFDFPPRSHRDHRQVAEAVFDAVYPAVGNRSFFPELLKKKLFPHTVEEVWFFAPEKPNKLVDIKKFMDKKIKALLSHKSQIKDPNALISRIQKMPRETFRVVKLT